MNCTKSIQTGRGFLQLPIVHGDAQDNALSRRLSQSLYLSLDAGNLVLQAARGIRGRRKCCGKSHRRPCDGGDGCRDAQH